MRSLRDASYVIGIASRHPSTAPNSLWITGYYPAWQDHLKPSDIDYGSLTHVIYFALFPTPAGRLDMSNGVNDATANALATAAHKAGKKVLICVGGDGAVKAYRQAIKPLKRERFVRNIVGWVKAHHFDGVDVDFEPMKSSDASNFQAFIRSLRARLNQLANQPAVGNRGDRPQMLLTAAVECRGPAKAFAPIQGDFDQLNLMTYDMAGPWSDETWYNSPLTNNKHVRDANGELLPATDRFVKEWEASVPASKLGIGICCEGRVWHRASAVDQPRNRNKVDTVSFAAIMDRYYAHGRYHWDSGATSPYLVVSGGDDTHPLLVVYDDERACRAKVGYVKRHHLGGVILWELSEQYRSKMPAGKRNPLLKAVHDAFDSARTHR